MLTSMLYNKHTVAAAVVAADLDVSFMLLSGIGTMVGTRITAPIFGVALGSSVPKRWRLKR